MSDFGKIIVNPIKKWITPNWIKLNFNYENTYEYFNFSGVMPADTNVKFNLMSECTSDYFNILYAYILDIDDCSDGFQSFKDDNELWTITYLSKCNFFV
jgi:hypothetical protein